MDKRKFMENRDLFDCLMELPILNVFNPFYKRYREQLLYLFFGLMTTVVSIGSFAIIAMTGIPVLINNIISWILSVLFAYITNRTWVFNSKSEDIVKELSSFAGGRLLTLAIEEAILLIFVTLLNLNALAVKIVAQIIVILLNYIISKLFVFKEVKES